MNHITPSFRRAALTALILILVFAWFMLPAGVQSDRQSFIVQGTDSDTVARLVEAQGGQVTSRLHIIHGVGALLTPQEAAALQAMPSISAISPNAQVRQVENGRSTVTPTADYPEVVGADLAWSSGYIGQGITVAVVDSGLDHQRGVVRDIYGKTAGRVLAFVDFVDGRNNLYDPNGHGTHIAGIIANSQTGADGQWNGVAPGVSLVGVRVLNEQGYGTYEDVILGIQWVVDNREVYNIRILNLSLVAQVQSPYWADPMNQASMAAWANGIVVVAAAGNGGPGPMSVGVPGNNPYIITVGAFTDNFTPLDWTDDYITPFSSAGPTLDGFVKPDLVAPGAHIVSTMRPNAYLADTYPDGQVTNHYFSMAGTSQSAATVSGVAALMLSAHPELTPNQVKYRLMETALVWIDATSTMAIYSMWQQGAGRVNAPDAVLTEAVGSANYGMDISADLAGTIHYQGFTYWDEETGEFQLLDDPAGNGAYGVWNGGYGVWNGAYGVWNGDYGVWNGAYGVWNGAYGVWNGAYGVWSGAYGVWNGAYGVWNGGYGVWNGGYGVWNGAYGVWNGGYGVWNGGYGVWNGSEPWAGTLFAQPAFVIEYLAGTSPDVTGTITSVGDWITEP